MRANWPPPAAGMAFIEAMAAVLTSLAQCRQIRLSDGPLLLSDTLRTSFSHVSEVRTTRSQARSSY